LDEHPKFQIPETKDPIEFGTDNYPVVIITSNREKGDLSPAFLRRCIYFHIEFPDKVQLEEIVQKHYPEGTPHHSQLLKSAIDRFLGLRSQQLYKKPGTSEFLLWWEALLHSDKTEEDVSSNKPLPYVSLLLKHSHDLKNYGLT
jgi:MoxR-like ATPase